MSVNTFLCKRYKKETVTVEDILPAILFVLGIITIVIIYVNGVVIMYNDYTAIDYMATDFQSTTPISFDIISVMVCYTISAFLVYIVGLITISIIVSYIMDIMIASCKKD